MRVAVGASSFSGGGGRAEGLLLEKGMEVVKNPYGRRMTEEEAARHLSDADGLLAGLEPLNENVFRRAPRLKAVARIGSGMDNVDLAAAERYGIKVSCTPEGPADAVAEMTLAALLALIHRIIPADRDMHRGVWKKRTGRSIRGLKVLVVGYGRIGKRTAGLLRGLGAEILVYDRYDQAASTCSLEEGLRQADAVTVHTGGTAEVIGAGELALMRKDAVLLNSARGPAVNEDALYGCLQEGRIAGFWGDALWQEPYTGKICGCADAVLTPHICTYTETCRENMETEAARNLLRDLGVE